MPRSPHVLQHPSLRLPLLLLLLLCLATLPAHAQRVALLVANQAYEVGRLTFPTQDAAVMRAALLKIGFAERDVVTVINADQRALRRAIQDFGRRANGAEVALLYYSGHATQALGQNWLIPIGADIQTEAGYELEAVSAQAALSQINSARPKVGIVVLDACRDNPAAVNKSGTKGLGRMDSGDRTILAFATAPNDTAADNGLYARTLAAELQKPGQELLAVFRRTTAEVRRASGGRQVPRVSEVSLDEDIYLAGRIATPGPTPVLPSTAGTNPATTTAPSGGTAVSLEDLEREEKTRRDWAAWQARMKADFDRTAGFQGSADLQVTAWQRFLQSWGQDNPLGREDDELRQTAQARLGQAQRAAAAPSPVIAAPNPPAMPSSFNTNWPERPVTIVVPFAAGGPTDKVARDLAEALSKTLKNQSVVIENVAGAYGALGANKVAKAPKDGYTFLLHHIGMATSPALYRNLPYKTQDDFEYVGMVNEIPLTLIGRSNLPANNFAELRTWINANKSRITLANAGLGAPSHLCGLLLQQAVAVDMATVPYRGTGPAMMDLLGGQVDLMCEQANNTVAQIEAGKVKAFAVTTSRRADTPSLGRLPTLDEAGLRGFNMTVWHGLYAPSGTPRAIIEKMNAALRTASSDTGYLGRTSALGAIPISDSRASPAGHKQFVESEIAKWSPVIRAAGQFAD